MKCNFCGEEIDKGREKIFVALKGNALYFCSGKCEKNQLKLRRKPRKIKWTKDYIKEKEIRTRILKEESKKNGSKEARVKKEAKEDLGAKETKEVPKKKLDKSKSTSESKAPKGKKQK